MSAGWRKAWGERRELIGRECPQARWPGGRTRRTVGFQQWLNHHAREGWATCPLAQSAFRICRIQLSRRMHANRVEAEALLQANLSHATHRFWEPRSAWLTH